VFPPELLAKDSGSASECQIREYVSFVRSKSPGVGPPPSSARSGPAANIPNLTVAGTLVAALVKQKPFSSTLLAHRRQREADPPPGSRRDKSLTVSPRPKAFHAETLEIAWVCTGRERTVITLSLAPISRAARGDDSLMPHQARRVVPRGTPQGRGGSQSGNDLLRSDS
jgi:hypothetical protein